MGITPYPASSGGVIYPQSYKQLWTENNLIIIDNWHVYRSSWMGERFSKQVYLSKKASSNLSVGPFLCLPTMISAFP